MGRPELQIFAEHTKKGSNKLTYQDKELVDVLTEFTRARARSLSLSFWQKNLDVKLNIQTFERTTFMQKMFARNFQIFDNSANPLIQGCNGPE